MNRFLILPPARKLSPTCHLGGKLCLTAKLDVARWLHHIDKTRLASLPPSIGTLGTLASECQFASLPHPVGVTSAELHGRDNPNGSLASYGPNGNRPMDPIDLWTQGGG